MALGPPQFRRGPGDMIRRVYRAIEHQASWDAFTWVRPLQRRGPLRLRLTTTLRRMNRWR